MTPAAFRRSLTKTQPPAGLPPALTALWWAGRDSWSKAQDVAMDGEGPDSAWVHAYLHRIERDPGNAGYWYREARKRPATGTFEAEWAAIVAELLAKFLNERR